MCTVCGCGQDEHAHHGHEHDHDHEHGGHHHHHVHGADGAIDFGGGIAGVHLPGMSQERIIRVERDILEKNDAFASANRARFAAEGILALNLVSSPGSGKTTLLVRAIGDLASRHKIAVIEGDQQT